MTSTDACETMPIMGMAKEAWEESLLRGWDSDEGSVCPMCVLEPDLRAIVERAVEADRVCDFCGASPATDFDILTEATVAGFENDFNNIDNEGIPFDSREGGYQIGNQLNAWDLVFGGEYDDLFSEAVAERVFQRMRNDVIWVKRDAFARDRDQVLVEAWAAFSSDVTYETRSDYWRAASEDPFQGAGEVSSRALLRSIDETIGEIGLIARLKPAQIWRGRPLSDGFESWKAAEIGTTPNTFAKSNRMSPTGVGLFYGSETASNALAEIRNYAGKVDIAYAPFTPSVGLTVLDLTGLPQIPSSFDPIFGRWRRDIKFLRHFADEISTRITPGAREYAPTQVVAAFLFNGPSKLGVNAIRFRSSLDPTESVWAVNVPNERCVDVSEPLAPGGPNLVMMRPARVSRTT